jgi:hypothetical protein
MKGFSLVCLILLASCWQIFSVALPAEKINFFLCLFTSLMGCLAWPDRIADIFLGPSDYQAN